MLGNLFNTTKYRVKNATVDAWLYNRDLQFVPTAAQVAERKRAAARTELENRLLGQYLDFTAAAVGNRAEFDAKWSRADIAYQAARATRDAAKAEASSMKEEITDANALPVAERSPRLMAIRDKARKAYSRSGNPVGVG